MIETGRKVTPGRWIPHPEVVLFLVPLLWRQQTTSSWYEADRSLTVVTKGYGHELTFWVILFAIAELLLFQIFTRLSQNGNVPNQAADSTVSAGTSAAEQPRVPASAASHL
jgi:hypothetical protein